MTPTPRTLIGPDSYWPGLLLARTLIGGAERCSRGSPERARRVIVLAQEEATALNHNYIGTEHLLLGVIRDGDGIAARVLTSMGIGLDAVRQAVLDIIGRGQQVPTGHIPFTPRSKKVLELSLREALQLGTDYIGTEHILLALLREGDGVAAQVLVGAGLDLNQVRQQVTELLLAPYEAGVVPAPAPDDVLTRLTSIAARLDAIERRLRPSAAG
jgi:ATP-dependent Clp protease ATP-binding subunit ClpC